MSAAPSSPDAPAGPDQSLLDHVRGLAPADGGLRAGEGLVVGVSGGADSLALLDLLHRLAPERRLRLVAAHLDHGLRTESDDDRRFCAGFCAARAIPFVALRVDVAARARRRGESLEAAGRDARRALFAWVRRRHGLDRVATGHHLDDHLETLLLWTLRGAGLRGAAGIVPADGDFVRPLRALRRSALRAYLLARGLDWREDASNADSSRVRNRFRHQVLPVIEGALAEEPGTADWAERLDAMTRRIAEERRALDELVGERLASCTLERGPDRCTFDRTAWAAASEVVRFQMFRAAIGWVQTRGPHQRWNAERFRDVLHFIGTGTSGARWPLPGGGWLHLERDRFILRGPSDEGEGAGGEEPQLDIELLPAPRPGLSFSEPGAAWFDAACVRPPFTLRAIRPGDRIRPHGMRGRKTVARLLGERAVPRELRAQQWVVSDADRILWLVGITTCDTARVTDRTEHVWRLRIMPPTVFPGSTP